MAGSRTEIESMLRELALDFATVEDSASEFNLAVTVPNSGNSSAVHILRQPTAPKHVAFIGGRRLGGALWDRVSGANDEIKRKILARSKQLFLSIGVQFELVVEGESAKAPREVHIIHMVDESRLDRACLFEAMLKVHFASLSLLAACEEYVA